MPSAMCRICQPCSSSLRFIPNFNQWTLEVGHDYLNTNPYFHVRQICASTDRKDRSCLNLLEHYKSTWPPPKTSYPLLQQCQLIVHAKVTAAPAVPVEQAALAPKINAIAHNALTKHTLTSVHAPAALIPADAPRVTRLAIVLNAIPMIRIGLAIYFLYPFIVFIFVV